MQSTKGPLSGMTPPSPWTSSNIMAAMSSCSATSAFSALTVVRGRVEEAGQEG